MVPRAKSSKSSPDQASSVDVDATILAIALPSLGALLIDPILGAVDTAYVGRMEVRDLGGLAVASAAFSFSYRAFNFLTTVTGPLVATRLARARIKRAGSEARARRDAAPTASASLALALVLGLGAGVIVVSAAPLLATIGGAPPEAETREAALAYLRVRGAAMPFALVNAACVGIFRGLLDTKTPLTVAVATNAINFVLDPVLIFGVPALGVPALGVGGAAVATAAAEASASALFVNILLRRERILLTPRRVPKMLRRVTGGVTEASSSSSPSPYAELAGEIGALLRGGLSTFVRTVALQATLLVASQTAARIDGGSGVTSGAHQVVLQVWWLTLFALDATAVAAQSLVADSLGIEGKAGRERAREVGDRCILWGVAVGGVFLAANGAVAPTGAIPLLFTDDADVAAAAAAPLGIVAALQILNGYVFVGDGIMQGAADFDYLARAMLISAGIGLFAISTLGGGGNFSLGSDDVSGGALVGVWAGIGVLQVSRAFTFWDWYKRTGPIARQKDVL